MCWMVGFFQFEVGVLWGVDGNLIPGGSLLGGVFKCRYSLFCILQFSSCVLEEVLSLF